MVDVRSLLTTRQAAERLGVCIWTVNKWAGLGRLPVHHQLPGPKGARLYRAADVAQLARDLRAQQGHRNRGGAR